MTGPRNEKTYYSREDVAVFASMSFDDFSTWALLHPREFQLMMLSVHIRKAFRNVLAIGEAAYAVGKEASDALL